MLANEFLGIRSPNPFWPASGPPTDKDYNVRRAFEAGWGGVVRKTPGEDGPPAVNINGPRYGVVRGADRRVVGVNNIELIVPEYIEMVTRWVKAAARMPVIVKLTPDVADIRCAARASPATCASPARWRTASRWSRCRSARWTRRRGPSRRCREASATKVFALERKKTRT